MKTLISLATALALALVPLVAPVMAGDSFHALSNLPVEEQAALTPLPDDQLASIEGEGVCVGCLAAVGIYQTNVSAYNNGGSRQRNSANVRINQGS